MAKGTIQITLKAVDNASQVIQHVVDQLKKLGTTVQTARANIDINIEQRIESVARAQQMITGAAGAVQNVASTMERAGAAITATAASIGALSAAAGQGAAAAPYLSAIAGHVIRISESLKRLQADGIPALVKLRDVIGRVVAVAQRLARIEGVAESAQRLEQALTAAAEAIRPFTEAAGRVAPVVGQASQALSSLVTAIEQLATVASNASRAVAAAGTAAQAGAAQQAAAAAQGTQAAQAAARGAAAAAAAGGAGAAGGSAIPPLGGGGGGGAGGPAFFPTPQEMQDILRQAIAFRGELIALSSKAVTGGAQALRTSEFVQSIGNAVATLDRMQIAMRQIADVERQVQSGAVEVTKEFQQSVRLAGIMGSMYKGIATEIGRAASNVRLLAGRDNATALRQQAEAILSNAKSAMAAARSFSQIELVWRSARREMENLRVRAGAVEADMKRAAQAMRDLAARAPAEVRGELEKLATTFDRAAQRARSASSSIAQSMRTLDIGLGRRFARAQILPPRMMPAAVRQRAAQVVRQAESAFMAARTFRQVADAHDRYVRRLEALRSEAAAAARRVNDFLKQLTDLSRRVGPETRAALEPVIRQYQELGRQAARSAQMVGKSMETVHRAMARRFARAQILPPDLLPRNLRQRISQITREGVSVIGAAPSIGRARAAMRQYAASLSQMRVQAERARQTVQVFLGQLQSLSARSGHAARAALQPVIAQYQRMARDVDSAIFEVEASHRRLEKAVANAEKSISADWRGLVRAVSGAASRFSNIVRIHVMSIPTMLERTLQGRTTLGMAMALFSPAGVFRRGMESLARSFRDFLGMFTGRLADAPVRFFSGISNAISGITTMAAAVIDTVGRMQAFIVEGIGRVIGMVVSLTGALAQLASGAGVALVAVGNAITGISTVVGQVMRMVSGLRAELVRVTGTALAGFLNMVGRASGVIMRGLLVPVNMLTRALNTLLSPLTTFVVMMRFAWQFSLVGAVGAATLSMRSALQTFSQMEETMLEAAGQADNMAQALRNIEDVAVDVARNINVPISRAMDSIKQLISAGFETRQELEELSEAASRLARAGFADVRTTTDAMISIIRSFGLQAQDADRVARILFSTFQQGRGTMNFFGEGLGIVSSLASIAGGSLEDIAAAVALVSRQAQSRRIFIEMARGLEEIARRPPEQIAGFVVRTREGLVDLFATLERLSMFVRQLQPQQRFAFLRQVFGEERAARFWARLLQSLPRDIQEIRRRQQELARGRDPIAEALQLQAGTLTEALQMRKRAFEEFSISFGRFFAPVRIMMARLFARVFESLARLFDRLANSGIMNRIADGIWNVVNSIIALMPSIGAAAGAIERGVNAIIEGIRQFIDRVRQVGLLQVLHESIVQPVLIVGAQLLNALLKLFAIFGIDLDLGEKFKQMLEKAGEIDPNSIAGRVISLIQKFADTIIQRGEGETLFDALKRQIKKWFEDAMTFAFGEGSADRVIDRINSTLERIKAWLVENVPNMLADAVKEMLPQLVSISEKILVVVEQALLVGLDQVAKRSDLSFLTRTLVNQLRGALVKDISGLAAKFPDFVSQEFLKQHGEDVIAAAETSERAIEIAQRMAEIDKETALKAAKALRGRVSEQRSRVMSVMGPGAAPPALSKEQELVLQAAEEIRKKAEQMQSGGVVPGFGVGDRVPALLEPGEVVLPNRPSDLARLASNPVVQQRIQQVAAVAPSVVRMQQGGVAGQQGPGPIPRWVPPEERNRIREEQQQAPQPPEPEPRFIELRIGARAATRVLPLNELWEIESNDQRGHDQFPITFFELRRIQPIVRSYAAIISRALRLGRDERGNVLNQITRLQLANELRALTLLMGPNFGFRHGTARALGRHFARGPHEFGFFGSPLWITSPYHDPVLFADVQRRIRIILPAAGTFGPPEAVIRLPRYEQFRAMSLAERSRRLRIPDIELVVGEGQRGILPEPLSLEEIRETVESARALRNTLRILYRTMLRAARYGSPFARDIQFIPALWRALSYVPTSMSTAVALPLTSWHARIVREVERVIREILRMQSGGVVPGSGTGDTVPALLEPGEVVLPRRLSDIRRLVRTDARARAAVEAAYAEIEGADTLRSLSAQFGAATDGATREVKGAVTDVASALTEMVAAMLRMQEQIKDLRTVVGRSVRQTWRP